MTFLVRINENGCEQDLEAAFLKECGDRGVQRGVLAKDYIRRCLIQKQYKIGKIGPEARNRRSDKTTHAQMPIVVQVPAFSLDAGKNGGLSCPKS